MIKSTIILSALLLSACGQSDLEAIHAKAIKQDQAAANQNANPFATEVTETESVEPITIPTTFDGSVTEVEETATAITDEYETVYTVAVAQEIAEPVTVPEVIVEPVTVIPEVVEPVTVIPEVVEPVTVIPEVVEPITVPEVIVEPVAFDPDGVTIFTYEDYNDNWNPQPQWTDSYSVGNRCYMHTTLDHGIGDVVVNTPYGPRTIAMVKQLLGDGPPIGDNPRYNDIQCGNGPANDFGDEDKGQCPGRVDQGPNGCGTIGPKWYFEQ